MTTAFRLMPAGVEEAQFKRVPEGWLFTVANPWIVAPRRTYLVNDAQKPAIAARVRLSRYVRLMVMLPTVLLMVAVFVADPTLLLNSLSVKAFMVFGAFVVLMAVAMTAADYLTVRPLIRDLPRTSQKISLADMMRSQSAAMSTKSLMIITLFFVVLAAHYTFEWLTSAGGHGSAAIIAVFLLLLTVMFGGMLIAKLRSRNAW
jgi:hypothetical protein